MYVQVVGPYCSFLEGPSMTNRDLIGYCTFVGLFISSTPPCAQSVCMCDKDQTEVPPFICVEGGVWT